MTPDPNAACGIDQTTRTPQALILSIRTYSSPNRREKVRTDKQEASVLLVRNCKLGLLPGITPFVNPSIPFVYHPWMQVFDTSLCDVKLLRPKRFGDERGWFAEFFNANTFASHNLPTHFVQDNQSKSAKGVLRGLHYQLEKPQGKLVRVLSGHIFDIAVDLRRDSPTFGKHEGFHLKPLDHEQELTMLWIPEGFAHGFLVLSESAEVLYKTTNLYHPPGERSIRWDDPTLSIEWPLDVLNGLSPSISAKDEKGTSFHNADLP